MLKIEVTDVETGHVEVYDYSNNNWAMHFACMRNGLVHMWAPKEVAVGVTIRTSGRLWRVFKQSI